MASFNIHLAVGKRYAEKNKIEDLESFYNGIIEPDLVEDKTMSHYTGITDKQDLLLYLKNKTQLSLFLSENKIDNDYTRGVFLHLITDYLFFNDFFDSEYIEKISYDKFIKDLYYSYDICNEYLQNKYDLNLTTFKNKIDMNIKKDKTEKKALQNEHELKNILEYKKLDNFIENLSNIDLKKYSERIIKYGENILP